MKDRYLVLITGSLVFIIITVFMNSFLIDPGHDHYIDPFINSNNQLAIDTYKSEKWKYKDILFSPFGMINGISSYNKSNNIPNNYTQYNTTDKQSIIVIMSYIPDDTIQDTDIINYGDYYNKDWYTQYNTISHTGIIQIDFINPETNQIQEHVDYTVYIKSNIDVFGPTPIIHSTNGTVRIPVQFIQSDTHVVNITVEGILFQVIPKESVSFIIDPNISYNNPNIGLTMNTSIIGDMIVSDILLAPMYIRPLVLYEHPEVFFGNNSNNNINNNSNIMYDRSGYYYAKYNDIEILEIFLKYGLSLYIIQSQNHIKDVEDVMTMEKIVEWKRGMKYQNVTLFIPEIVLNVHYDLTRLSYDLKPNNEYQYIHNASVFITGVNSSTVNQSYIDESQETIQFNAFRPFIFFIERDNDIIMIGKMANTEY